ncbi:MAG: MltA domain-containing protein, partial [Desulfuromonadales bacterium]|nr:MltA domain-containing protein [Desulfuromonadales bacterium]
MEVVQPPEPPPPPRPLQAVSWEEVDGWLQDEPGSTLPVFRKSCQVLRLRAGWQEVCAEAATLDPADSQGARAFFESRFIPYRVVNPDGSDSGMITGYYVPDLRGSRTPSQRFSLPLYGVPDDLLVIDLRSVYPELGNYRLRGRLEGRRVVPYWDREAIDGQQQPLQRQQILGWVEDPVELFFLHIQGSGRIVLEDGATFLVNYADQNGHPYRSIGKLLIEQGEMTPSQMSMQNIRAWARKNPDKTAKLLSENPSYVFFRELHDAGDMPPGALGVSLTAQRSLAVDPRTTPLGAPVFLATTWPSSPLPLKRLMVAQD